RSLRLRAFRKHNECCLLTLARTRLSSCPVSNAVAVCFQPALSPAVPAAVRADVWSALWESAPELQQTSRPCHGHSAPAHLCCESSAPYPTASPRESSACAPTRASGLESPHPTQPASPKSVQRNRDYSLLAQRTD